MTTLEEHLGYISDSKRLDLFRRALRRAVHKGDLVADIGCGFGVLGLLSLQAGASRVWGIDRSEAIEVARETMFRAGLADRYAYIRDHTARVTLPEPVDVIVCDHVGYLGIDYGIVEMVGDARRRFLKPGGRIVPSHIKLIIAGVRSAECHSKAEVWTGLGIPEEFHWLREFGVNSKHGLMLPADAIVTVPVELGTVDLADESPELLSFTAMLEATRDDPIDGLAGWFECKLAEDIWMTNSPLSEDAIDRPQTFLAFDRGLDVGAGDAIEVAVSIRHDTGLISWSASVPRTGQRQKQSSWKSRILSEHDLERNAAKTLQLNGEARARQVVIGYVDGNRTASEIEQLVLRHHPRLLPSSAEISRFVRKELSRSVE